MGNVFGAEKPLKEVIRENQRMINKAVRELETEITKMDRTEKTLINEIKKMAAKNQLVRRCCVVFSHFQPF